MSEENQNQQASFTIVLPTEPKPNLEVDIGKLVTILEMCLPQRYVIKILCQTNSIPHLENTLGSKYQHLKVISQAKLVDRKIWQSELADVLLILDGDLSEPDKPVLAVVENIDSGSDMALMTHYTNNKNSHNPVMTCFSIRKDKIDKLKPGSQGHLILCQVFGEDKMTNLVSDISPIGSNGFWRGLKSLINAKIA